MERLPLPEGILFACEFLNRAGQGVEALPEAPVRSADHGRSCRRPARISSRTFSATEARRPFSEKSLSIWRSQAALSRSRIKAASSVSSSGERVSTAVFISVRLTGGGYRRRGDSAMLSRDRETEFPFRFCIGQQSWRDIGVPKQPPTLSETARLQENLYRRKRR